MLARRVTHDHGGPVRLYVAPMYGYKSVKWLSGIEVTEDVPGYWEHRGYDVDGFVGSSNGRTSMSAPDADATPRTGQTSPRFTPEPRLGARPWPDFMIICILTAAILYNGPSIAVSGTATSSS